jgi:hypothetical protein
MATSFPSAASQPADWFANFPDYTYAASISLEANDDALATKRPWGLKLQIKRMGKCRAAQFDHLYGTDTTKLEIWQKLCHEVYIPNPPDSIKGYREVSSSFASAFVMPCSCD